MTIGPVSTTRLIKNNIYIVKYYYNITLYVHIGTSMVRIVVRKIIIVFLNKVYRITIIL